MKDKLKILKYFISFLFILSNYSCKGQPIDTALSNNLILLCYNNKDEECNIYENANLCLYDIDKKTFYDLDSRTLTSPKGSYKFFLNSKKLLLSNNNNGTLGRTAFLVMDLNYNTIDSLKSYKINNLEGGLREITFLNDSVFIFENHHSFFQYTFSEGYKEFLKLDNIPFSLAFLTWPQVLVTESTIQVKDSGLVTEFTSYILNMGTGEKEIFPHDIFSVIATSKDKRKLLVREILSLHLYFLGDKEKVISNIKLPREINDNSIFFDNENILSYYKEGKEWVYFLYNINTEKRKELFRSKVNYYILDTYSED